jgi:hypothetical protein
MFSVLYPLTLVLMGTGYGRRAFFFEKVVINNMARRPGVLLDRHLHALILLELAGRKNEEKTRACHGLKGEGCRVGDVVNMHLGRLGRVGIPSARHTLLAASVAGKLRDTLLTLARPANEDPLKFNKKHRLKSRKSRSVCTKQVEGSLGGN